MESVVPISSVSSDYKVYQAGSGQKNAKQSRQGHHHAFNEREGPAVSGTATMSNAAGTADGDGGNEGSVGKTVNVTA
jgi:hypothetical protein